MLISSLRDSLIPYLQDKRVKMKNNGSNCANIDLKIERYAMNPRIVCAAICSKNGNIVTSARHYDCNMLNIIGLMDNPEEFYHRGESDQGFIDQFGKYYTREEAYVIAKANGQIIRDHHITGELFSEHLY